jgi:hypothetical protein
MACKIRPVVNEIDALTLCLVTGFVRKVQDEFALDEIPEDIIGLCASFYCKYEYFARLNRHSYSLSSDLRTITKLDHREQCVFGNVWIHSVDQRVFEWTFQIVGEDMNMCFGITSVGDRRTGRDCFSVQNTNNYGILYSVTSHRISKGVLKDYKVADR